MPRARTNALVRSVESVLSAKQAVAAQEKSLIDTLNRVLVRMGYEVVPRPGAAANPGRRRRGRRPGRPPGRPPGRASTRTAGAKRRKRRGRPPKAENAAGVRRRGRPPKVEETAAVRRRGRPPKAA
jgi:hypothetical protein